jgi:hypothetical protein
LAHCESYIDGTPAQTPHRTISNTRFCGVKNWEILHVFDEKEACGVPHEDIFIEDVEVA